MNGYAYNADNPVNGSDPAGLYGNYCVTMACVDETGGPGSPETGGNPTTGSGGNGTAPPTGGGGGGSATVIGTTYIQISGSVAVQADSAGLALHLHNLWQAELDEEYGSGGWNMSNIPENIDTSIWMDVCDKNPGLCSSAFVKAIEFDHANFASWQANGPGGPTLLLMNACSFSQSCGESSQGITVGADGSYSNLDGTTVSIQL